MDMDSNFYCRLRDTVGSNRQLSVVHRSIFMNVAPFLRAPDEAGILLTLSTVELTEAARLIFAGLMAVTIRGDAVKESPVVETLFKKFNIIEQGEVAKSKRWAASV